MTAHRTTQPAPPAGFRISIYHVPDCPSVGRVRAEVEAALDRIGATAVVEEIEGAFPSPTVLIDGAEIDGYPLGSGAACRIGLPASQEIEDAILARARREHSARPGELDEQRQSTRRPGDRCGLRLRLAGGGRVHDQAARTDTAAVMARTSQSPAR